MNNVEMKAIIAKLTAENAALKTANTKPLTIKVSLKGGASVYGLGRWPVTLYKEQWTRLLDISDEIRDFITANDKVLTTKANPNTHAKKAADDRKAKALTDMNEEDKSLFANMSASEAQELVALVAASRADEETSNI